MGFPVTRDDRAVETLLNHLDDVHQFERGPSIPSFEESAADQTHNRFDIEVIRESAYDEFVHDIIDWLSEVCGDVEVDNRLATDVAHGDRHLRVHAGAYRFSPYRISLVAYCDGRVKLRLQAYPFGSHYEFTKEFNDVYNGPVSEFSLADAREEMRARAPYVHSRVDELLKWHDAQPSQARVIALRELGWTYTEISDRISTVSSGSARSYVSKFNDALDDGLGLFIARSGEPKRVLSKHSFSSESVTRFICRSVDDEASRPLWLVRVASTAGADAVLDISSERFESVGDIIEARYDGADFETHDEAQDWKTLFTRIDETFLEEDILGRLDEAVIELSV